MKTDAKFEQNSALTKLTSLFLFLFCFSFLLNSCALPEKTQQEPSQEQLLKLSAERKFHTLLQRGTLRVAVSSAAGEFAKVTTNGKFKGHEIELIQTVAQKAGFKLYLFDARPEAISAYIRSGRADLALGGFSIQEIHAMLLLPALDYQHNGRVYAFAIAESAGELKELLEQAAPKANGKLNANGGSSPQKPSAGPTALHP